MNVIDYLKELSVEEVKEYCQRHLMPVRVAMMHVNGDFNFSQIVRTSNFFGVEAVHYWGKKKWDRRGAVGTQNYTDIHFHVDEMEMLQQFVNNGYKLFALENNIDYHMRSLYDVDWQTVLNKKVVVLVGEESEGLSNRVLDFVLQNNGVICNIPCAGSVRSLNVASTFGIVAAMLRQEWERF